MSNTNTDQRFTAAQLTPITNPTAASITYGQISTTGQNNGATAGNAQLPVPGQFKALNKKIVVRLYYTVFGASTGSQALTVTINFVNNAATPANAIIATTGAVTAATLGGVKTVGGYLEATLLVQAASGPTATQQWAGSFDGISVSTGTANALVTKAVLTNQPVFTAANITGVGATEGTDENQYFQFAITLAQTDSTFVFTPLEFSVEIQ
jgi:hypothetical protein